MIRTKQILTKIGNSGKGKMLSTDDLKHLQDHLIKMYRDIEEVCKRHGLGICLAYGNVIGAMRHNGWIPWDDDLDIHMSRKDYDLFLSKYSHELPPQYKVSSYLTEGGSAARFAKVIDTSTVHVPIGAERTEDSGVYIDIFPIDNVKDQPVLNKFRRLWAFFLMYTATSVMQVQQHSKAYRELMFSSRAGKFNWYFRQLWGYLFSWANYRTWHKWIEKFGQTEKETGYSHVISDLLLCFRPTESQIFFPFKEINLPDIGKVHIPNDYNRYLEIGYGDWKKIPKDSEKWHHYVSELIIPSENSDKANNNQQ